MKLENIINDNLGQNDTNLYNNFIKIRFNNDNNTFYMESYYVSPLGEKTLLDSFDQFKAEEILRLRQEGSISEIANQLKKAKFIILSKDDEGTHAKLIDNKSLNVENSSSGRNAYVALRLLEEKLIENKLGITH